MRPGKLHTNLTRMIAMLGNLRLTQPLASDPVLEDNAPSHRDIGQGRSAPPPGCLGIMMQAISPEIAIALDIGTLNGALITDVTAQGPAAKAGLRLGDVITGYAGRDIAKPRDLARAVADTLPGSHLDIALVRAGKPLSVSITIGQRRSDPFDKAAQPTPSEFEALGLKLGRLSPAVHREFEVAANVTGVLVNDVRPGSPADEHGVKAGDIVLRFGATDVDDPAQLVDALKRAEQAQKKAVGLLINRAGVNRFVGIPLSKARR